ncbi:MAG: choice-of-anchor J domain-containing protein, partial [Bacteroidales bacterium]|nr:choice-of-anchor J domain-containing protein [Bacteroidales bacterium]
SYGGGNPDPEPSNYPTDFTATNAGLSVNLEWTDAVGTQLPSAYIIMAGISSSLPVPADGTPVPNDTDLSDGSGALNVPYGEEMAAFGNLESNTTYYFSIYSYTNNGANIDFKTDGTAPTANASTTNITIIESENFDESWGNWDRISVVGTQEWDRDNTYGINNTPCASMTGYEGQPYENDDWLVSPPLNLDNYENEVLVFYNALGYTGPDLELKISTDYDGGGDPYSATWSTESFTFSTGYFEWTESGDIDLSGYDGSAVYVAFQFTSTDLESATWEVDDILITGEEDAVIDPEPSNYPTGFEANASGTSIDLSWTDAIGAQLPGAYIIFASTSASLPTPTDGTPVPNDTDLSDGSGALNVAFGLEEAMFSELVQGTTYYFSIYPYTNNGINIDYKNDGTAPTANDIIPVTPEPTNYPANFTADATSTVINLSWTDATGTQLPEAYIIFAGTTASLPTPTDGTPVPDDTDLSDGSGALNVVFGLEEALFSDLVEGTTYYFSIYPYTNSGTNIDYKNDGVAPTANATTLIIIEPTNYPTNFAADAISTAINLSWTDATGTQLPETYIIFAGTSASLPTPADGIPTPDDLDLSDGLGAANVDYGVEEFTFGNLQASTTYYFSIYPYTGSGTNINYKNDGIAPTADATTEEPVTVIIESENFDESWGNWDPPISVVGSQVWDRNNNWGIEDTPCAAITGYEGQPYENDDWLVSPPLNLDNYNNEILVFKNALGYNGPDLQLKISTGYDGGGDPYSATWSNESFTMSTGYFEWTESGEIDLSGYNGSAVYVAFQFTSTNSESATWEVDDIEIKGEEDLSSDNQIYDDDLFRIYPNPSTGILFFEKPDNSFNIVNIVSLTGSLIKTYNLNDSFSSVEISDLNKGLYFIMFHDVESGQTISKKLILR